MSDSAKRCCKSLNVSLINGIKLQKAYTAPSYISVENVDIRGQKHASNEDGRLLHGLWMPCLGKLEKSNVKMYALSVQ